MSHKFAALGRDGKKVYLYKKSAAGKLSKARQVLWGDFLRIDDSSASQDEYLKVLWAQGPGNPPLEYFIRAEDTSHERPLEVIFLDVGQGDSAIVIGAARGEDERIMIVDGGISDNLDRFLASRFKYKNRSFEIQAAVITHPDKDHYNGFKPIFENGNLKFKTLFHNGLLEQHADMGPRLGTTKKEGGVRYQTQLLENHIQIVQFYGENIDPLMSRMLYPNLLHDAIVNDVVERFAMLSTEHGIPDGNRIWVPGFTPNDGAGFTIEVLGPIAELDADNNVRLRRISSSDGKTKNGHSVLLRLTIGGFTIMLGGDLNSESEKLILQHYANIDEWPKSNEDRARMIESARHRLKSDLLKVCHHGSADVTDEFLQAVDPAAFVISSGDEEGHVHPRPDLLGRLGRNGRGFAPLILSTELQRSTREGEDQKDRERIEKSVNVLDDRRGDRASDIKARDKAKTAIADAVARLSRSNVSVYGAIHVKTDGEKLIVAFRIETNSMTKRWHYYEYQQDVNGTLLPLHEVSV